ncbi:MAG: virulence protein RhuM/Fic/DOC family protein, partial [Candidatus Aminicenantes bacterium]|nr:virulence protein RhuM/Fic/DOC family protein [Acidobacteriota bacterium]MCG2812691.1 virulence protein RhuM/Fic/DOC family protein [Candidatus Aminicenantes bacterium]
KSQNNLAVYQTKDGAIELRADSDRETVWATQAQIAEIFDIERSVITKHVRNIIKDGELDENSVCAIFAHTAADGKTYNVNMYNLDVILAVGYRTNSAKAVVFRQWATKTLREYITKGFVVNKIKIKKNYDLFLEAIEDIKKLIPLKSNIDHASVLELVTAFSDTWLSLNAYDKDDLVTSGSTKKNLALKAVELEKALTELKVELIKKAEATDLFGRERQKETVAGIIGNVMQSFAGKELYPTVEEKAVHLLYFIIKNHPFIDGNKRSAAFSFVWFLKKAGLLEQSKITPPALTALTLFIAESNPKNKDRMVKLVLQLLKK